MTEQVVAVGDIGATNFRIGLYNTLGEPIANYRGLTDKDNYKASIELIAQTISTLANSKNQVVSASIALAAESNESGVLIKAGGLTSWVGNNPANDLESALGLNSGLVGTPNDVEAIAISQQFVNKTNHRELDGIVTSVSSGLGAAMYYAGSNVTKSDEPGHFYLRDGGICTCGEQNHAEAFVGGGGVEINHGKRMKDWLDSSAEAKQQFVDDLSMALIQMVERYKNDFSFIGKELRLAGGVALHQPFIMQRVATKIRDYFGEETPIIETVTMGEQAGLHGAFVDALRRTEKV